MISFKTIFPALFAIIELIDLVDAKIISDDGLKVLRDPEKMKVVEEAIKNNKSGIIVVNFKS